MTNATQKCSEVLQRIPETSYGFRTRLEFVLGSLASHGLPLDSSTNILDVGSGTGELLAVPLAQLGLSVVGIDQHPPSIARARQLAAGTDALFRAEEIASEVARGERYSVTLCSEVLEHLVDPLAMLVSLRQLTRSDGLCIITVPNGVGAFETSVRFRRWYDASPVRRLYHGLRAPIRRLRGYRPRQPATAVVATPTATLNAESGHIQFFRWAPLVRMFDDAGFELEAHRGRTLLCGHFLDPMVDQFAPVVRINARLAGWLPTILAAGWMFRLRPKYSVPPSR